MIAHTGFLVTARRLADGVTAPARRRRPAKGAHPEAAPPEPPQEALQPQEARRQEGPRRAARNARGDAGAYGRIKKHVT